MKFVQYIGFSIICCLAVSNSVGQPLADGIYATIFAEENQFVIELKHELTPMTVASFVGLAEGSISNDAFPPGRPFFDGSSFDRVVPGHVLQGGVPASDKASNTGYTLPNEISDSLHHDKIGMFGLANAGPHTGSNIFYITLGDRSYLDGDYTVFGEVICFDTYDIPLNTTIDSVRIIRVGREAEAYWPDDAMLNSLRAKVISEVEHLEQIKQAEEIKFIRTEYPDLLTSEEGWQYQIIAKGKGKPVRKQEAVKVRYYGVTPQGLAFESKADGTTSWRIDKSEGEYFAYSSGTNINAGFEQAIAEMRPGAKYVLVLSPEFAYGTGGYYPPQRPSEERFHFSPNTTLIYHIEIAR
jgi:cyclophilin family peptidyl-prolyl cis-trans isomerase